jgi:hypothetical protein
MGWVVSVTPWPRFTLGRVPCVCVCMCVCVCVCIGDDHIDSFYRSQPYLWEVPYGDTNSLTHPVWVCGLGKHFMVPSHYDKIPPCRILYFVKRYWTTGGINRMGTHSRSENSRGASVALCVHPTHIHTHAHRFRKYLIALLQRLINCSFKQYFSIVCITNCRT